MEKLIELLNEWQEKELGKAGAKYLMFDGINNVFRLNNGCSLCQELVLSQRFCFIKWLVQNNKIDLDFDKIYSKTRIYTFGKDISDTDYIIMLLSIQDNPTEFLVSILR